MANPEDDSPLLKVAEAVSDGHSVDWDAEQAAQREAGKELGRLRLVAAVAEAHRKSRSSRAAPFQAAPSNPQEDNQAVERALATSKGTANLSPAPRARWRRWLGVSVVAVVVVAVAAGWFGYPRLNPGPFKAEAILFRQGPNGTEERLLPGARVHVGDGLFLEIRGQESMYVYVVQQERRGLAYLLFPADLDLKNPLLPRLRHRLPGRRQDGMPMTWQIDTADGSEDFLVVASRKPLPELEQDLASLPRGPGRRQVAYAPLSLQSRRALRGIGGLLEAEPPAAAARGGRVSGIMQDLPGEVGRPDGLWTWRIQLENPTD